MLTWPKLRNTGSMLIAVGFRPRRFESSKAATIADGLGAQCRPRSSALISIRRGRLDEPKIGIAAKAQVSARADKPSDVPEFLGKDLSHGLRSSSPGDDGPG
jgi:hypothetical protein